MVHRRNCPYGNRYRMATWAAVTSIISKPTLVTLVTMRNTAMVIMGEMRNVKVEIMLDTRSAILTASQRSIFDEHPLNLTRKFLH